MDFVPPPNRDDFKEEKEYEVALRKWQKEFEKAKKSTLLKISRCYFKFSPSQFNSL